MLGSRLRARDNMTLYHMVDLSFSNVGSSATCLKTILQWIPSHCDNEGNEQAERMAKLGAEAMQVENSSVWKKR